MTKILALAIPLFVICLFAFVRSSGWYRPCLARRSRHKECAFAEGCCAGRFGQSAGAQDAVYCRGVQRRGIGLKSDRRLASQFGPISREV
jgi:hypothetical protein